MERAGSIGLGEPGTLDSGLYEIAVTLELPALPGRPPGSASMGRRARKTPASRC